MLTGQNGILSRAAEAKEATGEAQEEELVRLAVQDALTNGYGTINVDDLNNALSNAFGKEVNLRGDSTWTYQGDNNKYKITSSGGVEIVNEEEVEAYVEFYEPVECTNCDGQGFYEENCNNGCFEGECQYCNGTGKCPLCLGASCEDPGCWNGDCNYCHGTGKCQTCFGNGKTKNYCVKCGALGKAPNLEKSTVKLSWNEFKTQENADKYHYEQSKITDSSLENGLFEKFLNVRIGLWNLDSI